MGHITTPLAIVTPDAVTPAWLSAALGRCGIEATVRAFDTETVGTGQLGETRRFQLSYAGKVPPGAPASLIGKFASDDPTAVATSREMGLYRSEVMFYRELAPWARIRTPRVYAAELSDDAARFVLLLEDLAPARAGDHMQGCSPRAARRALDEAALLHAATWNDADLMAQPWVYTPAAAQGFHTTELLAECWSYFRSSFAEHLEREVIEVCTAFVRHYDTWNAPRIRNRCFAHGDFRVDNMLFGDGRVCVVDWQTGCFIGAGMDVAYFLGGALAREARRAHEASLRRHYHARLLSLGVSGYPLEDFMADYRHYCFAALTTAIVASKLAKRTERGDRLFMKMASDAAWQVLDNDALSVLGL